jgi:hypothetical protein
MHLVFLLVKAAYEVFNIANFWIVAVDKSADALLFIYKHNLLLMFCSSSIFKGYLINEVGVVVDVNANANMIKRG